MEDQRPTLKLVTGRCAGIHEGQPCESTELVFDGYCARCAVDFLHETIAAAQSHFDRLTRDYPELLGKTKKGFITREPFASFVKRVASLRKLAEAADFGAIPVEARKLHSEMAQWEVQRAGHLASIHSKSSTEGWGKAIDSKTLFRDEKFLEAASAARSAIVLFQPFEDIRQALLRSFEKQPADEAPVEATTDKQAS